MSRAERSYRAAHRARKAKAKKEERRAKQKALRMAHVVFDETAPQRRAAMDRIARRMIHRNVRSELAALEAEGVK